MASIIQERAYVCTPSSLLASTPCLACLSEKEMLAAIVGIFAVHADLEVATVLKSSACFTCMSKKQMLQALVTILGNQLLGENNTVEEIIDSIRCLECSSEKQLLAAILYLICGNTLTVEPLPT